MAFPNRWVINVAGNGLYRDIPEQNVVRGFVYGRLSRGDKLIRNKRLALKVLSSDRPHMAEEDGL
ncbi:hypothetical protein GCM10027018_14520 [Paenibacillus thermoaerophilus]